MFRFSAMPLLLEIEKPNPRKSYHAVQDVVRGTLTAVELRVIFTSGFALAGVALLGGGLAVVFLRGLVG